MATIIAIAVVDHMEVVKLHFEFRFFLHLFLPGGYGSNYGGGGGGGGNYGGARR